MLALMTGDMIELLTIARMRSANFSRLKEPCWICPVAGSQLDQLHGLPQTLRSMQQSDAIIDRALGLLQSRGGTTSALGILRDHSLLAVRVLTCCFLSCGALLTSL
jgi:hypothetical protein